MLYVSRIGLACWFFLVYIHVCTIIQVVCFTYVFTNFRKSKILLLVTIVNIIQFLKEIIASLNKKQRIFTLS